jgi:glutamate--cysteine ligase
MATWFAIDPTRTAPPMGGPVDFATYALDARVMLVHTGGGDCRPVLDRLPLRRWLAEGHELGWPLCDDLEYHLTTLFPPVRPKGWLEIRYLDAVGEPWWPVAAAVTTALLDDPDAAAAAARATAGTGDLWLEAARVGLDHPALAASAQACFDAALQVLDRDHTGTGRRIADATESFIETFVARRRCPADEPRPTVMVPWS